MVDYVDCGQAPQNLGAIDLPIPISELEMMFYLYLPVKLPDSGWRIPPRLAFTLPLLHAVSRDIGSDSGKHVYVTAKSMFVSPGSPGNRPGWHIDGFQSNGDLNYIWSNMNPTEFAVQQFDNIPNDDAGSMTEMARQIDPRRITIYPDGHLLKLDERVVHRVNERPRSGHRVFVKITVSDHRFAKAGNSRNYLLDYDWALSPRQMERNLDHV